MRPRTADIGLRSRPFMPAYYSTSNYPTTTYRQIPTVRAAVPTIRTTYKQVPTIRAAYPQVPTVRATYAQVPTVQATQVPTIQTSYAQVSPVQAGYTQIPTVQTGTYLGGSYPGLRLISQGKGIDANESTQITNACISAVNQGAYPLSKVCAENIKRNLNGEWFVFISNEGQEDFNFSLTRCKGLDYMVFTYGGKKFQVNRLQETNIQPIQVTTVPQVTQVIPASIETASIETPSVVKPAITLRPIIQNTEVVMQNLPTQVIDTVIDNSYQQQSFVIPPPQPIVVSEQPSYIQGNLKLISVGNGIDSRESSTIQSVCLQAYQQRAFPLSRVCANRIKARISGDWFVFISNYGQEDFNFSLTRCKGSDFMVFIIDDKKFQVCRLKGLS